MINVIGPRRAISLGVLFLLNLLFVVFVYLYLFPGNATLEKNLVTQQAQISTLRSDVERLRIGYEEFKSQKAKFEALDEKGFLTFQDRRSAEKLLQEIQEKSRVLSAVASIKAGEIEENEDAEKAGYQVLSSLISIQVEALDDTDIFMYLDYIRRNFSGYVSIEKLDLKRKGELTGVVLRSISAGDNPTLAEADIELLWRTMIPKTESDNQEEGGY